MSISRRKFLGNAAAVAGTVAAGNLVGQSAMAQTATTSAQSGSLPGLIAHWKLNGDAKDSIEKHHGEAHNIKFVEGRDGKSGGAASFNGVDSFVRVDDDGEPRNSPSQPGSMFLRRWMARRAIS